MYVPMVSGGEAGTHSKCSLDFTANLLLLLYSFAILLLKMFPEFANDDDEFVIFSHVNLGPGISG